MRRDDLVIMRHMLYTARKAVIFTDGKRRDDLDRDATYSLFMKKACELIGRGAWHVSPQVREALTDIPWAALMAMSDMRGWPQPDERLDSVWSFLNQELPGIVDRLETIIREEEGR